MGNTNYAYAFGGSQTDIGNVRETFFFSQMEVKHNVTYSASVDFTIDEQYNFEIGGKSKTQQQLSEVDNGYLALDNIEVGFRNEIPLWLFGMIY